MSCESRTALQKSGGTMGFYIERFHYKNVSFHKSEATKQETNKKLEYKMSICCEKKKKPMLEITIDS